METPLAPVKGKGPIIDPALCRCCRSIKKCRVLTAEYEWTDKKEVYSEMIMDCFGLLVSCNISILEPVYCNPLLGLTFLMKAECGL